MSSDYLLYFSMLAILWLMVWSAVYFGLRQRDISGSFWGTKRRRNSALAAAGLLTTLIVYVLSYPPFLYFRSSWPSSLRVLDDLYVPLQWAIDHTWLRQPLVWWAEIWEVDSQVAAQSAARLKNISVWGTTDPWLYAIGYIAFGTAISVLPPYLLRAATKRSRIPIINLRQALPH